MDLFSVFQLCGGLAFFLYGMSVMSKGLEKMAGSKLESSLKRMTTSKFKGLLLGVVITIAIQSSSAMTVMLVGFVNSGIMELGQTIGVIMGSNIGTTLTAWILSLAGINSEAFLLKLLKPSSFSPVVALVGIAMIMLSKRTKKKDIGGILIGFSILMYGMTLMTAAVSPLANSPRFASILTAFSNPALGVLVGAVFTGIIQSSAASVGILQALSLTGGITYQMAIPIIMGQNIGTCATALISSIGVTKNAKQVAIVHILFNLIGTAIFLSLFLAANALFDLAFVDSAASPLGIAIVHSVFNVSTTILLYPFSAWLEKLAKLIAKDKDLPESYSVLDERLLQAPSFAIAECHNVTVYMAHLARETIFGALDLYDNYSDELAKKVSENENRIDAYEDKLGSYLVKISGHPLSDTDSREVSRLLHTIGDFERIGDHAVNIMESVIEMREKNVHFSEQATAEMKVIIAALREILTLTIDAFNSQSVEKASHVEPLEQVIDDLKDRIRNNHISRLQSGGCTIELGFILSDLLTNFERVSDHCSNIAVCIIELEGSSFDTHGYLSKIKSATAGKFAEEFAQYSEKYELK